MSDRVLSNYIVCMSAGLNTIVDSWDTIVKFANQIEETTVNGGTVYVAGNGGSAAISDHLVCDCVKNVSTNSTLSPRVVSLVSNVPMLTAISNDISYEESFSYYFERLSINPNDMLIVISSSGNSPNIVKVLESAKKKGIKTAALVGFSGGKAKDLADVSIHIPIKNYGVCEDLHQSVMHIVSQYLNKKHINVA